MTHGTLDAELQQDDSASFPSFLDGGGELGAAMRSHDWSTSPLGRPANWPQALRTVVRLMLSTGHPMCIWWGRDGLNLYNDAYRDVMGAQRHPAALGQPADEVWKEAWHIMGPQADAVMTGGGAIWKVDQYVPITRDGRSRDAYWTYSYSPIDDDSAPNRIGGVLVICTETTQQVIAARQLADQRDQLTQLFEQTPTFVALLRGPQHVFELANPGFMRLVGHRPLLGLPAEQALPEAREQGFVALLDQVYSSGEAHTATSARYWVPTSSGSQRQQRYIDFVYQPIRDVDGCITSIFVEGADVTARIEANIALNESDERFRLLETIGEAARAAVDPREIMQVTTRVLGEHLHASRCAYADVEEDHDLFNIRDEWSAPGQTSSVGLYSLHGFGPDAVRELGKGNTLVVNDVDRELAGTLGVSGFGALQIKSIVCCPLIRADGLRGMMAVHSAQPRRWTPHEIALVRATAERSWAHLERVRSESLLRINEARLTDLIDTMPSLIWTADVHGELLWVSRWMHQFTGRAADRFSNRYWREFFHPDDLPQLNAAWAHALQTASPYRCMARVLRADGQWRWLMMLALPVTGDHGEVLSWCGSGTDVHEFKDSADALQISEARFRGLVEAIPGFIWTADRAGEIAYVSPRFKAFSGKSEDRLQQANWSALLHPEDLARVNAEWARVNALRVPYRISARFRRHDGVWRWLELRADPEMDASNRLLGWNGYAEDQHEQKEVADALALSETRHRDIAEKLADANRLKDEFLATLAHELRNPLAPIRNALELMNLAPDDLRVAKTSRQIMERQLAQMVRLVDDLLDLYRVSRGAIELRRARIALAPALQDAIVTSRPLLVQLGHTLTVTMPDEGIELLADATRIVQIFANLINNAAKFTPPGGHIAVTLRRDETGACAEVRIRDDGLGISPAMLGSIFDMFTQVDRSHAHVGGGLGIGLTLVRRLVDMHGGSVEARSNGPGTGSEFIVRLPLAAMESAAAASATEVTSFTVDTSVKARRILVADDNIDAADSLATLLDLWGHQTRMAHDGAAALALAGEYRPDVVVLDIAMPLMDGHAVARAIRRESWGQRVLLIAVSGWGQPADTAASIGAGFDDHLVKPIDLDVLARLLAREPA